MFMTNTQYSELFDFLSLKFEAVDLKLEKLDKLEKEFSVMQNTMDLVIGELKSIREEITMGAHRSYRMESWIVKAAKKINLPYNP